MAGLVAIKNVLPTTRESGRLQAISYSWTGGILPLAEASLIAGFGGTARVR
jgi:hypothetical protein